MSASTPVMYTKPNAVFGAIIAMAVALLSCIWSWRLHIPHNSRLTRRIRARWYLFLAAKFIVILATAHQITVHMVQRGLPPQLVIVGCVAAFLWAQHEQRQRCPVCLHQLARPVRVGTYAQIFLGWNGTESVCLQGHGTLYLDFETAGHASRAEWIGMDSTWADLFLANNSSG